MTLVTNAFDVFDAERSEVLPWPIAAPEPTLIHRPSDTVEVRP